MTVSEFDLHVHTKYSFDSILKPEKLVKVAKRNGLCGLAITDHGTIQGGLSARNYNTNDLIIITGAEIRTDVGDIIGLFLNQEIRSIEIESVIDEIHDQDGLVILPHPFRGHDMNKFNKELLTKIDAVEVYNGRTNMKENILAQKFAETNGLPAVAGSDAHFAGEIGFARTIISNSIYSDEDIRNAILKKETKVIGTHVPMYFQGASRVLSNLKTGNLHKLPYTLLKITVKGIEISLTDLHGKMR
ncbi:MAG: PHP domain-containing protein [Nitrospiraceae bacterium]|nr:PHP domain-containing protein [Nitrospiraceae bacterium]